MTAISNPFLRGTISLFKPNPSFIGNRAYDDAVRGTNLMAKAGQLVNDLAVARKRAGDFKVIFDSPPKHLSIDNAKVFSELVKRIKEKLATGKQSFTVPHFLVAQRELTEDLTSKKVDVKA